jgi:hypothetical protein
MYFATINLIADKQQEARQGQLAGLLALHVPENSYCFSDW